MRLTTKWCHYSCTKAYPQKGIGAKRYGRKRHLYRHRSNRWLYQILMCESFIPLTAVSTPSGMPLQWLVMPQGLKNAPATFHRMVSQVLRPLRDIAPSYFNDIFAHSRAEGDLIEFLVYLQHLKRLFQLFERTSSMRISRSMSSAHRNLRCWVAMWLSLAFELIQRNLVHLFLVHT